MKKAQINHNCTPYILGFSGLIPFFISIFFYYWWLDKFFLKIAVTYGAIILTFVGSVYWGIALIKNIKPILKKRLYFFSVIPAIFGWLSTLIPTIYGLVVLFFCFASLHCIERKLCLILEIPAWYIKLRLILTIIVCFVLLGGILMYDATFLKINSLFRQEVL